MESTTAASLYAVVKDVLLRLNLSANKLRAQCYDGASVMAGKRGGLAIAEMITDDEPKAVYIHCYGHALNLACSDAVKNSVMIKDSLDTAYEVIKLVRKSSQGKPFFKT